MDNLAKHSVEDARERQKKAYDRYLDERLQRDWAIVRYCLERSGEFTNQPNQPITDELVHMVWTDGMNSNWGKGYVTGDKIV